MSILPARYDLGNPITAMFIIASTEDYPTMPAQVRESERARARERERAERAERERERDVSIDNQEVTEGL